MRARVWYVHFPGAAHALSKEFERKVTEREVRVWAREWGGLGRLPRGFEAWPAPKSGPFGTSSS